MKSFARILRDQTDLIEIEARLRHKFIAVREHLAPQTGVVFSPAELERVHFRAVAEVFSVLCDQIDPIVLMEKLYPATYAYALMEALTARVKGILADRE
ncbi:hypothetical protein [Paraburkholderia sp. BCC1886]|uniref:hypothetical protein n=1 Tax=Paraburkholderia sp. BCC1886 TaxID=2562670 RepID=UPI001182C763|nr:hypothetical protein [Paraburkholderia sp. BCC1886]